MGSAAMLARNDDETLDDGPRGPAERTRRCVVTRAVGPADTMVRFVAGPDQQVVPDVKCKLPGRGAWVTARHDLVARAAATGALRRAFRKPVTVAPDIADATQRLLERALLDALAIAYKAGDVVSGYVKVVAALESASPLVLVHARDAAPDGVRKLTALAARHSGGGDPLPVLDCFESEELDLALGRTNVIHAAVLPGRAGRTVLGRWRILENYRTGGPGFRDAEQTAARAAEDQDPND